MKIGVLMLATAQAADIGAVAQKTEALGFDSLWLPFNLSPEELMARMAKLRRLAQEARRNPDDIEVTLSWTGNVAEVDTIKRFQDIGLHRLICALPVNEAPGFGPALEKLAEQTVEKVG